MKKVKVVFIALISVLSINSAYSQFTSIGGKLGLTLANQSNSDGDTKGGVVIGLMSEYSLTEQLYLQPELNFIQKGTRSDADDVENRVNYIHLPIMVKYYFNTDGNIKPYINAGPYFGYWVGGELDINGFGFEYGNDFGLFDLSWDNFNRFEFGLGIGGGATYEIGNGFLYGDLRYQFAFTETVDEDDAGGDIENTSNRVFTISVGYAINLN